MVRQSISRTRAVALLAAAPLALAEPARAQMPVTIRIGSALADSYAQPYFAADGGFFRRAGINVEFTMLSNGSQLAAAMAGNALDIALSDPLQLAHSVNAGVPFAFFAGGGLYRTEAPATLLVVAKNSPLRAAADLEGQTIVVAGLGSLNYIAVREWLRQGGANLDKIRFVELPYPAIPAALLRGTIAAGVLAEPFLWTSHNELRTFGKPFDAIATSFYITGWFATRTWLTANPELAKRVAQVANDSARWANTHRADTAPILAKYLKLDPSAISGMTRVSFATSLDERQIQPVLDIAYRYKQLDKPVNASEIVARV
jgi:NitT/TauT family transport system substrate-binding protein